VAKLSREEVEIIAELAKLTLTEEEKVNYQQQLSNILDYAEVLRQVDTDGIPPTTSALPLSNVMRPDIVSLSLDNEETLFNAPATADGNFKVQSVLD
jgi:aspartyl-tRNA(Asn)/glutamyl-tRNA(Gln) amidotransferase subunit C